MAYGIAEIDPPVASGELIEENSNSPEAGLVSIQTDEVVDSADEQSQRIDELLTIGQTLGDIRDNLGNAQPNGEIGQAAAGALEVAVEHFRKIANLPKRTTFVLENFQGKYTRKKAITYAMESLWETIQDIIKKVLEWLKTAFTYCYNTIESWFVGAQVTTKSAKQIQEKVEKVKDNFDETKAQSKKITNSALLNFFNKNTIAYSPDQILEAYKKYNADLNEDFSSNILEKAIDKVTIKMDESIRNIGAKNYTVANATEASHSCITYLNDYAFDKFTKVGNRLEYALPFGNAFIVINYEQQDDRYTGVVTQVLVPEMKYAQSLPVLTPAQITAFTKSVSAQMNSGIYRDYHQIKKQLSKVGDSVVNMCDLISKAQTQAGNGSIPSLQFLKTITSSLLGLTKVLYRYNSDASRLLLSYCDVSLAAY